MTAGALRPPAHRRHRFLLFVAVATWSIFTFTASGRLGSSDAEAMFNAARSLADHGSLDVGACEPSDNHCVPGVDGRNYSGFGILPSLLSVPPLVAARALARGDSAQRNALERFAVSMIVGPVTGALLVTEFSALVLGLGYRRRAALGMAALLAIASPFWFYSAKGLYSEPLFALCLVAALIAVSRDERPRGAVLAGLLFGAAMLTRLVGVILLPAFAGLARRSAWRRTLGFGAAVGTVGLLVAYLNYSRFGSPLRTGYHLLFPTAAAMFSTPWSVGLRGLLFDGTAGLLWFFPVSLFAPAAWRAFHRRHRDLAVVVAVACILQLLFFMKYTVWAGGWSVGPRMLLPVLPLLALPFVEWIAHPTRARRVGLAITLAWSAGMQALWVLPPHFRMFTLRDAHRAAGVESPADRSALVFAVTTAPRVLRYAAGTRTLDENERTLETAPNAVNQLAPDVWWIKALVVGQSRALFGLAAAALAVLAIASARAAWRQSADDPGDAPPGLSPIAARPGAA